VQLIAAIARDILYFLGVDKPYRKPLRVNYGLLVRLLLVGEWEV
jgi:hypothetical protein